MNSLTTPLEKLIRSGLIAVTLLGSAGAQAAGPDGQPHRLELRDRQFFIDRQPLLLVAGEMHFGRVQPEDWELRLKQAKAMGLNTVSFYLFWNQVEAQEGHFDFTGMNDVRRVLRLCQENGLWAILRPGPYCCAEVEYGGIPAWTLKRPEVKIRTIDPQWLAWCRRYLREVHRQVGDLQVTQGGPLLMVQVENEYGIIADPSNNDYMQAMRGLFVDAGFDVQLFTCDPKVGPEWNNPALRLPGMLQALNGLHDDQGAKRVVEATGDFPVFVPEVYTAWFSGWGSPIAKPRSIPRQVEWTNYLLDHHFSFCFYMFFGGTNYGFFNGCNQYLPVQTSYDYDAPIDEAGRVTEKYRVLRELLSRRLGAIPPPIPADPPVIGLPAITLAESEPLLHWLPSQPSRVAGRPLTMEELGQAYGCVIYRKKFPDGIKGVLDLTAARDYTVVMVNGRTLARAFRGYGQESSRVEINESGPVTLDLLVYNLGRISVPLGPATQERARKGLVAPPQLDGRDLLGWEMFSLPLQSVDRFRPVNTPPTGPAFYRGTFQVDQPGGTFLDLRNWSFGAVWVNGHNLGRFWDRGALRSLFLPAQWLKRGTNEIIVLELHDAPRLPVITGGQVILEEPAVDFPVRLDRATAAPATDEEP